MNWKDKLGIVICFFVLMVVLLFTFGWTVNTLGIYKADLQILLQTLGVIQKFLEFLLGGV